MTLNIGVIGTGAIGQDHMRRCHFTLSGSAVTAVNDINTEAAKAAVDRLGIPAQVFENPHDLINSPTVDAILVCSWGPTHEEFVLGAIKAGKPVFCEKPLASTAEGCQRIVDAELSHGTRLVQVGYMRPWDKGYQALKTVIDRGDIGTPLMLHCAHRNPSTPDFYDTSMAVTDTLVHELDVLRWLIGEDYVSAQVVFPKNTTQSPAGLRDPQIVLLETTSGIRIDVEIFVNCKYGYDIQCEVVGEQGTARLPEPMSITTRANGRLSSGILTDWKQRFIEAYDIELQAFVDGAVEGKIVGPSSWNGLAAAIAADACAKAQLSGAIEPIEMPQRPSFYDAE